MNILYTLDSGFEEQLIVSIRSLIKHTNANLNIFIIFDDISNAISKSLTELENDRVRIKILASPEISDQLVPDRGSKSQYYRLYITYIFEDFPEVKKVLYLDCDTLIMNSNVEKIFNINMGSHVLAATIDPWSFLYKDLFNLKKNSNMFNDGVFLVDILSWKKKNYDKKIEKTIASRKSFVQADQGILNEVVQGEFRVLEPKFNAITSYFEMNYKELIRYRKPVSFYSEDDVNKAVVEPVIIHFTSTFLGNRPWLEKSHHPYKNEWLTYLYDKKNYTNISKNVKFKNKLSKKIFENMPRKISIIFFGYLQAYVRPSLLRIKMIFK